jgi:MHS family proline/betaine transporter-like MFS transporter
MVASTGDFYCIEESTMPATIVEIFPQSVRYTGISLSYNLVMVLIGGTAPFMNTWLVAKFNNPMLIACYLMSGALISLMIIYFYLPKNKI